MHVLPSLVPGDLCYAALGNSIGLVLVPSGRKMTARVADMAIWGHLTPHVDDVLPVTAVPEALESTGQSQVRGKFAIMPS